jgi:transcriptional regulator with XRE-family HTH domain
MLVMASRIGPKKPAYVYLADWREHFELTQQQVGDRIGDGVSKSTVSRWETAERVPTINVLGAYAEALGIPVEQLFRPPNRDPSLDAMIAKAPKKVREMAIDLVKRLVA